MSEIGRVSVKIYKSLFILFLIPLAACSTNPATGKTQFAGLMSPSQEVEVGASEHEKIRQQYGFYEDARLQAYVNSVGAKVTAQTERPDVAYKFFILDSPIVNAFALPGGYLYVSRGLLALANSEAELAAVLSHETGHITARHSAERYSHGVVTTLGAAILSAAIDSGGVTQALGAGNQLYLSSYSRGQEDEADTLGLRYMTRGGYDPAGMSSFLASLQREGAASGQNEKGASYFSTHPATGERVAKTYQEARQYAPGGAINRNEYLEAINGIVYGDSMEHGFARDQTFYHPPMGFAFTAPPGYRIINQPQQVVAVSNSGAVVVFDMVQVSADISPADFITQGWLNGKSSLVPQNIQVNGMPAATTGFDGTINGRPVTVQMVAIRWKDKFARFQVAIPKDASGAEIDAIRRTTYSFRNLGAQEIATLKPQHVNIVTATSSDSIPLLAAKQPFGNENEARFRLLNALTGNLSIQPGQKYKIVQ
jgi:predicted Zn-dependent protease